jgi:hypothetical protein
MEGASNKTHSYQPPPFNITDKNDKSILNSGNSKVNNLRSDIFVRPDATLPEIKFSGKQRDPSDVKTSKEASCAQDFFADKRKYNLEIRSKLSQSNGVHQKGNISKILENDYQNAKVIKFVVFDPETKTGRIHIVNDQNMHVYKNEIKVILPVNNGPWVVPESLSNDISEFRKFQLLSDNHTDHEVEHIRQSFQHSEVFIANQQFMVLLNNIIQNKIEVKAEAHKDEDKRKIDTNVSRLISTTPVNGTSIEKPQSYTTLKNKNLPDSKLEVDKEKDDKAKTLKHNQDFRENESKIKTEADQNNRSRIDKAVTEKNKFQL